MPSKTPTRSAAAQKHAAAAAPSLGDMIAQAVAAALAAQGILPGGTVSQAVEQIVDPVTGRPFVPKPTRTQAAAAQAIDDGTVSDTEYPANHPDTGKAFKVPPRIRQRFMQAAKGTTFNVVLRVTNADGTATDIDLADLKPHRFGTGNHGLMAAQIKEDVTLGDTEYTLTGGINLMLGNYRLDR